MRKDLNLHHWIIEKKDGLTLTYTFAVTRRDSVAEYDVRWSEGEFEKLQSTVELQCKRVTLVYGWI